MDSSCCCAESQLSWWVRNTKIEDLQNEGGTVMQTVFSRWVATRSISPISLYFYLSHISLSVSPSHISLFPSHISRNPSLSHSLSLSLYLYLSIFLDLSIPLYLSGFKLHGRMKQKSAKNSKILKLKKVAAYQSSIREIKSHFVDTFLKGRTKPFAETESKEQNLFSSTCWSWPSIF